MEGKAELRARILELRRNLSAPERIRRSALIQRALAEHDLFHQARSIALYRATPGEVATGLLELDAYRQGKQLAFPSVVPGRSMLRFRAAGPGTSFTVDPLGFEVPVGVEVAASSFDLIVVPGVAFDRAGGRVGRGKGCYDQTLAVVRAHRIGIAFEFQVLDRVPTASHDVPMDWVFTEGEAICCRR